MEKGRVKTGRYLPLIVCGGSFLVGAVVGLFPAGGLDAADAEALSDLLSGYRAALAAGAGVPGTLSLLWNGGKWPLLVFLLGLTALGVGLIPAVHALRGFLLSLSVALMVRAMAGKGAALALVLFGTDGLLTLPILLFLGCRCWAKARGARGRLLVRPGRGMAVPALICFCLIFAGALLESAALPPLLRGIVPLLTGG